MSGTVNAQQETKKQIERIDKGIRSLITLSEITRFKNIPMRNSFADEFFKKMKNYITIK